MKKVAIAGATGAVGRQMLECIRERNLPVEVKLLAGAASSRWKNTCASKIAIWSVIRSGFSSSRPLGQARRNHSRL